MKDGLLEETVTTVQQDSTGYIWIASQNALQRYDGKRFLNFTHRATDSTSMPAAGINSIIIDQKNRLWILSGMGTVAYLDVKSFRFRRVKVVYPNLLFTKTRPVLHLDKDGNVLLLFVGAGYLTFSEEPMNSPESTRHFHYRKIGGCFTSGKTMIAIIGSAQYGDQFQRG